MPKKLKKLKNKYTLFGFLLIFSLGFPAVERQDGAFVVGLVEETKSELDHEKGKVFALDFFSF